MARQKNFPCKNVDQWQHRSNTRDLKIFLNLDAIGVYRIASSVKSVFVPRTVYLYCKQENLGKCFSSSCLR
ncbi:hypothetical protein TNCT_498271 [Trichonephila clavata]|uniref:Uncharacterized protein n=1 Tax=Trichonephila clavata TaxID=2740835 RepID=A0A8X6LWU8_TRICU|nr:hypothetical protein TNCT_498271 [Trichonephila clavata]